MSNMVRSLDDNVNGNHGFESSTMMHMQRPLLILDLDETLVYADEQPLERACDFRVGPYHVYRRPFIEEFWKSASEWFEMAVWTSSGAAYASLTVRGLLGAAPLAFLWSRERCTRRYDPERQDEYWLKDLKKVERLGYSLDRILMVDDSPEKLQRNYGNHIRVTPFVGDPNDIELQQLISFLEHLRDAENVRSVEKRGWRSKV